MNLFFAFSLTIALKYAESAGIIGSHQCMTASGGVAIETTQCVSSGGKFVCPPDAVNPMRVTMGCELESSDGMHYCCPQFCPDRTPVYYAPFLSGGALVQQTPSCTGPADTSCAASLSCQGTLSSDNSDFFCCANPSGAGTPSPTAAATTRKNFVQLGQFCPECRDQGTDCPFRRDYCQNRLYFDLMTWQCPVTCNRCPADGSAPPRPPGIVDPPGAGLRGATSTSRNCRDNIDCPTWVKNGFCRLYPESAKEQFCPLSCRVGCGATGK